MNLSLKDNKIFFILLCFCLLLTIPAGPAAGQEEDEGIIIDFVDSDLADVIRVLATSQNLNYIIGDDVVGKVTIRLEDVSFETALEAVVISNGYAYKITENILYVNTLERLKQQEVIKEQIVARQELVTFVFELKFLNADDVKNILEEELSDRGKIFALKKTIRGPYKGADFSNVTSGIGSSSRQPSKKEEATRLLVVIDVPSRIERVQELISQLDRMPAQVLIDTKMVEMTLSDAFDFGIKWNFLGGGVDGTGGLKVGASKLSTTLSDTLTRTNENEDIRGVEPNEDADSVKLSTKEKGDYPSRFEPEELFVDAKGYKDGLSAPAKAILSQETNTLTQTFLESDLTTATLSITDVNLILNALQATNDVEIVSNPTILTLNNQEASILVGERYPIIQTETSEVGFTTESLSGYEPIGIHLQVVPQVMDRDYVNMIIRPAVTSLGSPVQGNNISINRITTREASTQAIVKSGETIVIGGLLSERLTKIVSKLPFLGDIPFLGWAFKNKRDAVERINLMVFVTPTIIRRE